MNLDFHYYGTFAAARLAGYGPRDAQIIAHAAQYVDESGHSLLNDANGKPCISDFRMVPTAQSNAELCEYDSIAWSGANLLETFRVWIPFHFLPGNYDQKALPYSGPREDRGWTSRWRFTQESEMQFKLLCQQNSLLAGSMVNNVRERCNGNLEMIGLCMHVLCDTWAHSCFCGIPAWFINNAGQHVMEIHDDRPETEVAWQLCWDDDWSKWTATPLMPAYNSYAYLGHGRMGHLPDYPYMKYRYLPQWSNRAVIRDNTSDFLKAFKQMAHALTCILNNKPFEVDVYEQLDEATEKTILGILGAQNTNQCDAWQKNIAGISVKGSPLKAPDAFDRAKWQRDYFASADKKNTSYYRFNEAATKHQEYVRNHLESKNLFILSGDESRNVVTVRLRNRDGAYIGKMSEQPYGFTTQYYPRMSNSGLIHRIIKPDGGALRSGAPVEIKTTEQATTSGGKEYAYLGAWETPALYYYLKDYDIGKQRWIIRKWDLSKDDVIRPGDLVCIMNQHFTDKPYIAAYTYQDGYEYLTTIATPTEWIVEEENGHSGDTIRCRTANVTLQGGNGQFIGPMSEEQLFPTTQYFPKMRPAAITFSLFNAIDENSRDPLRHGQAIKVKTNESATGNYCFLGAWETPSLYYYKKDYDIGKQSWTIEKINLGPDQDPVIRVNDRVRLKNHHYTSKPYLAWHRTFNDNYLTTIANATDDTVWVIRA